MEMEDERKARNVGSLVAASVLLVLVVEWSNLYI